MYSARFMQAIVAVLAIILLTPCPSSANDKILNEIPSVIEKIQNITEERIRDILERMEKASNDRNVDAIIKLLSPNVTIELREQSSGSQTLTLNREDYRDSIQQGFSLMQSYKASYSNLRIKIAPDGKTAIATYNFSEEATVNGQTFRSTSSETVKFELIQDLILVTSIEAIAIFN